MSSDLADLTKKFKSLSAEDKSKFVDANFVSLSKIVKTIESSHLSDQKSKMEAHESGLVKMVNKFLANKECIGWGKTVTKDRIVFIRRNADSREKSQVIYITTSKGRLVFALTSNVSGSAKKCEIVVDEKEYEEVFDALLMSSEQAFNASCKKKGTLSAVTIKALDAKSK